MSRFINLRGYGEHTKGSLTVTGDVIARAADYGQDALAITDARTLAGVPDFVGKAKAAGIKPIIGMEVSLATSGDRLYVHRPTPDSPLFHDVTLLARTARGWANLVAINNATQDPAHARPVVDLPLLARHAEGLILLTGGMGGPIAEPLVRGEQALAEQNMAALTGVFGPGSIYAEVTRQGLPGEDLFASEMHRIAGLFAVPVVATSAYSYADKSSARAHAALKAAGASLNGPWSEPDSLPDRSLRSEEQMRALSPEDRLWQDAVDMTSVVADTIDDTVFPEPVLPRMPRHRLPNGYRDPITLLRDLAVEGLNHRDGCTTPEGMWRLNAELNLIAEAEAAKYFLLLHGLVSHLRSRGITMGPGRGNASSSLVLYGLGVTDVDPIESGLHFETFLVPGRGLPVFDLDLERSGVEAAISYLAGRYGKDHVGIVSAYLRRSGQKAERLAQQIMDRRDSLVPGSGEFELAGLLTGRISSVTNHPAAVILSAEPLSRAFPLRAPRSYENPAVPVIAWTRREIEFSGALVINLLGLHSLTPMGAALKAAADAPRAAGQAWSIPRASRLDLPSVRAAWRLLYERDLPGLKLSTREVKEMLDSGRTKNLSELTSLMAVSLNGTGTTRAYLASSADPIRGTGTALAVLSRVTADTRGILLFREQIAEAAVRTAGYTTAEGLELLETLREASPERLAAERARFTSAVHGHLPPEARRPGEAEALFSVLAASAPAVRSKAHSAGMALRAFNQAWLMSSFPGEYGSDA
ncbi:PHP domain-containing protein [Arthrobacter sp. IK3]|uniref:PHP domain-containing protein n=1 Tax=Arthrobacter sp. IK3 TaxID=3448169 RepID=UPI003EDF6B10